MKKLIAGILIGTSSFWASAALVIDYSGSETRSANVNSIGEPNKKILLLDQSVEWAEIVGIEKCGANLLVSGSGVDVPLSMALRMLTPQGWKVFADDDVPLESSVVTWRTGITWTRVIAEAAEANKFRVVINCNTREMSFKSAPDLGSLADIQPISGDGIGKLPEADLKIEPEIAPLPEINSGKQAKMNSGSNKLHTEIPQINSGPEPMAESLQSYFQRYADNFGYSRVAFRIKTESLDSLLRKSAISGKAKSFTDVLRVNNLIQLNATDVVSNESVMVITSDIRAKGSDSLLVFHVTPGMLSENSIQLAKAIGWKVGAENLWPLDVDYKVSYGYDIVMIDPVDAFSELFGKYPIQAQLVIGSKVVSVVKRNSPNRSNF